MTDERVARWRDTWEKIAASEFAGETVYSHEAFGVVLAALADAEARLATLAALDPIVRYGSGWYACHFCDQEHNHRNVTHAEDCPWVLATGIRVATPRPDVGQGEG